MTPFAQILTLGCAIAPLVSAVLLVLALRAD